MRGQQPIFTCVAEAGCLEKIHACNHSLGINCAELHRSLALLFGELYLKRRYGRKTRRIKANQGESRALIWRCVIRRQARKMSPTYWKFHIRTRGSDAQILSKRRESHRRGFCMGTAHLSNLQGQKWWCRKHKEGWMHCHAAQNVNLRFVMNAFYPWSRTRQGSRHGRASKDSAENPQGSVQMTR